MLPSFRRLFHIRGRTKYNRWTLFLGIILLYHLSNSYWHLPVDIIRYYELQKRLEMFENGKENGIAGASRNDQPTCNFPKLDPYDASIRKYISKPNPLICKRIQSDLTYLDDRGILRVNETEMKSSGYTDLECSARCFDQNTGVDDDTPRFGEWVRFEKQSSMGCQFVEVSLRFSLLSCESSASFLQVLKQFYFFFIIAEDELFQDD
jgi:hypothetical protein